MRPEIESCIKVEDDLEKFIDNIRNGPGGRSKEADEVINAIRGLQNICNELKGFFNANELISRARIE